jgi:hypothetical protein
MMMMMMMMMMLIIIIIIIPPPLVLSSRGIIPNKLKESLKLLNLLPGLHIVMQKAQ